MSQKINIILKSKALEIIYKYIDSEVSGTSSCGYVTLDDLIKKLDKCPSYITDQEYIDLSGICNILYDCETCKMVGGANKTLLKIKNELNNHKQQYIKI